MGLNFVGSKASWSYGGFHAFRKRVAAQIGIDLEQMEGFGGRLGWNKLNDPIVPLLNHSDCEGELSSAQCKTIAPRLRELLAPWPDDAIYSYDIEQGLLLVEGMENCAKDDKPLIFT